MVNFSTKINKFCHCIDFELVAWRQQRCLRNSVCSRKQQHKTLIYSTQALKPIHIQIYILIWLICSFYRLPFFSNAISGQSWSAVRCLAMVANNRNRDFYLWIFGYSRLAVIRKCCEFLITATQLNNYNNEIH